VLEKMANPLGFSKSLGSPRRAPEGRRAAARFPSSSAAALGGTNIQGILAALKACSTRVRSGTRRPRGQLSPGAFWASSRSCFVTFGFGYALRNTILYAVGRRSNGSELFQRT
jgi:hypothetical protein